LIFSLGDKMKRTAFTMLELVFVIIVIGILAVLAMPNFNRQPLQEAAEQIASHIRYTQHLAMIDDKYDNNVTWFQGKWAIDVCQPAYQVSTLDATSTATDPQTGAAMNGATNEQFDLANKFEITAVAVTAGNCRISFDSMGRPYAFAAAALPLTTFAGLLNNNINIALQHADGNATITVVRETGYVSVTYP
jgi:prepilin-type N-terminal cleavage/methylation domain-containing protein